MCHLLCIGAIEQIEWWNWHREIDIKLPLSQRKHLHTLSDRNSCWQFQISGFFQFHEIFFFLAYLNDTRLLWLWIFLIELSSNLTWSWNFVILFNMRIILRSTNYFAVVQMGHYEVNYFTINWWVDFNFFTDSSSPLSKALLHIQEILERRVWGVPKWRHLRCLFLVEPSY